MAKQEMTVIPRAKKQVVAITVTLEVMTPDMLKKIVFGFTKGAVQGVETWTIDFELYTRDKKSDEFGAALVDLHVEVKTKNQQLAEETALNGLNRAQVKHAITRSAPTAERFANGKTSQKIADRAVEGVVPARVDA